MKTIWHIYKNLSAWSFLFFVALIFILFNGKPIKAADMEVNIHNATMNQPGRVSKIKLFSLGKKMQPLGIFENARGKVLFKKIAPGKKYLVTYTYQNVQYFKMVSKLELIAKDTSGNKSNYKPVTVLVYEHKKMKADLTFRLDHLVVQKDGNRYIVRKTFWLTNNTKVSGQRPVAVSPPGGLLIDAPNVPQDDIHIELSQNNIPDHIRTSRNKKGQYVIASAIKPGQSQLNVAYRLPGKTADFVFPFDVQQGHLYVSPMDIVIDFSDKKYFQIDQKNTEQDFTLYHIKNLPAKKKIVLSFSGGTKRNISSNTDTNNSPNNEKVVRGLPVKISGLIFVIILSGFLMVYLFWVEKNKNKVEENHLSIIIQKLADLENKKQAGMIEPDEFAQEYAYLEKSAVRLLVNQSANQSNVS